MIATPVRALIVEDEPAAREAIRTLLGELAWAGEVREAHNGLEALDAFRTYRPQLVFLDVQLPLMSGIDALEQSDLAAAVIFTTAQDDAAIVAFELGAIDYLHKPFGRDRFALALERAQAQIATLEQGRARGDVPNIAERMRSIREARQPLGRIYVRDRRQVIPIATRDIIRCEADDDYVVIHSVNDRRHHAYINMRDLVELLDPRRFVRVHRSHLVNMDFVTAMSSYDPNRVELTMTDGTKIVASRTGTQMLRARIK